MSFIAGGTVGLRSSGSAARAEVAAMETAAQVFKKVLRDGDVLHVAEEYRRMNIMFERAQFSVKLKRGPHDEKGDAHLF
jgi:hypothetical protein